MDKKLFEKKTKQKLIKILEREFDKHISRAMDIDKSIKLMKKSYNNY